MQRVSTVSLTQLVKTNKTQAVISRQVCPSLCRHQTVSRQNTHKLGGGEITDSHRTTIRYSSNHKTTIIYSSNNKTTIKYFILVATKLQYFNRVVTNSGYITITLRYEENKHNYKCLHFAFMHELYQRIIKFQFNINF